MLSFARDRQDMTLIYQTERTVFSSVQYAFACRWRSKLDPQVLCG